MPKPNRHQRTAPHHIVSNADKPASKVNRRAKLSPEDRQSLAEFHESAYRMGWAFMGQMLEQVAMLKDARTAVFTGVSKERCQPDMVFVRGMLDAAGTLFGDAAPLMRSKFGVQLQEALLDDFFDNTRAALAAFEAHKPKMPGYWR